MNRSNRDLLVLFKQDFMSRQAIEQQVELLHDLLQKVERPDNVSTVCELIDINNSKISKQKKKVFAALVKRDLKPFVFINCRN